jgi:hypothetical protein
MKTHTLLDTALLFLMLSFALKIFLTMARFGSVSLPVIALPREFQYLAGLFF